MKISAWNAHRPRLHTRLSTTKTTAFPTLGPQWSQRIVMLVAIAVLVSIGLMQLNTPDARPATSPTTEFSADRAIEHLNVIAAESRAIGMPGHDATRDYLVEQLTMMGLGPELQTTTAVLRFDGADTFGTGMVTNVIARMPGTSSTGAIALNAHYDSGATGPGASDNGSGVVAVLETVRAIQAGPALANDVVIVFSDGEENGDLGAAAFNQDHRLADGVRLTLNFEAQGSGGPAILYATSDQDGWLTSEYFAIAPRPSAYSMLPEFVRLLPGMRLACDLQDYLIKGSAGLGFLYASDTAAYHTERDSVEVLDSGSIQQEGENTLAVVRHFGNEDLVDLPLAPNRVFFNVLPNVVVHYSGSLVLPLAALVTLLVLTVIIGGFRRHVLTIGGLVAGILTFLLGTVGTVALVMLLWAGIRAANSDYQVLLVGSYQTVLYAVALTLSAVALMTALYVLLQRRVRADNLTAGAVFVWTLMMWGVSLAAPGASYVVLWPLLFGLLPLAWSIFTRDAADQTWLRTAVLVIAMVPSLILLPGTYYQIVGLLNRLDFFSAVIGGFPFLGLWALFVAPLLGLSIPQLRLLSGQTGGFRRWSVPTTATVAAVVLIVLGNVTSGFDATHPRPDHIAYELDADSGEARWVSIDQNLDEWTSQFFQGDPVRGDFDIDGGVTVSAFVAPAPVVDVESLSIELLNDTTVDDMRTLTFRLLSPRNAARLDAEITGQGEITAAAIDGRSLDLGDYALTGAGKLQFGYSGVEDSGVEVSLTLRSTAPVSIAITEMTYGLPEIPGMTIQPRTPEFMPATGMPLDATVVRKAFTI